MAFYFKSRSKKRKKEKNNMLKPIIFLLLLISTYLVVGCNEINKTSEAQVVTNSIVKRQPVNISEKYSTEWSCEIKQNNDEEVFKDIKFFDSQTGVALSSEGSLMKTNDGGNNWKTFEIKVHEDARLTSASFISPQICFVVFVKFSKDVLAERENKSFIMKTVDGGKTWNESSSLESVIINDVKFLNTQEGWAVGRMRVRKDVLTDQIFILHTNDSGQNWENISFESPEAFNDFAEKLIPTNFNEALILSIKHKIYKVNAANKSILLAADVTDEKPQTYLGKFGLLPNGGFWLAGGANSVEGTWGTLLSNELKSWVRRNFDFYLDSAIFISEKEVFISGQSVSNEKNSKSKNSRQSPIKFSSDAGVNWLSVCKDKDVAEISAFSLIDENHLWAVGGSQIVFITRQR
jgi:Photosynthesis system II assembly factor YCF48